MKKNLLLLAISFLFVHFAFAQLTLKHSYTFSDGTANDEVSGANGSFVGGNVINGAFVSAENGAYIELPAAEIAINTYSSITFEAYTMATTITPDNSMLWYFGGSEGSPGLGANGTFLAPSHWDGPATRAAISCGNVAEPWAAENAVTFDPSNTLNATYHLVVTMESNNLNLYVNGVFIGNTAFDAHNSIANLSNDFAWLGRGGYANDPTWLGTLFEFNIYSGIMDDATVLERSLDFPIETSIPTLASLTPSEGTISPEFSSENSEYELLVPYGTTSIQLSYETTEAGSSVAMYDGLGNEISNGIVNFSGDGIGVEIIVTGLDGSEYSYFVEIFVDEGSSDATLSGIDVSAGALHPVFNKYELNYQVVVPSGTTSVDVNGIATFGEATVSGNGTVTLSNGTGTASLTVTSADASTSTTYQLNIEEADGKNYAISLPGGNGNESNINLSGLSLYNFPYTIEMWMKPNGSQAANTGMLYLRSEDGHAGIQYSSDWQGAGRLRYMSNIPEEYGTLADVVAPDVWHHVAVVMTANSRTIYLDGVKTSMTVSSDPIDFSKGKLYLGWDSDAEARAFNGLIDEVRIWNDSLSQETIEANSYEILSGSENGLLAYYNFDVPTPSYALDATTNPLNGLITGGTYVESFPRANLDLDTLYIEGVSFKPGFNSKTTEYYVTLAEGTTSVNVNASPRDQSVTLEGTGNHAINGNMGAIELTVTSADGIYSLKYVIHYVVETSLSLKHAYTFADGTAKDVVGGADGVIAGGTVENGTYIALEQGQYIELPGEEIAINTYPAITVEAYITAGSGENGGNTMLTYFGNTTGSFGTDYYYTAVANGGKSRAAISTGSYSSPWGVENGVDGLLLDDGMPHHVVSTLTYDSISWYIDGLLVNRTAVTGTKLISNLSNALAYIGKSGYVNDATWIGSVFECNIYSGVMDDNTIAMRSISFPVEDESSNATLASLMLDGDTIETFASYKLNYDIALPEGTTSAPVVTASTSNTAATAVVTNAATVPGVATVLVTAADGTTINTYTITFSIETSNDASLSDLAVNGTTVDGFDPATYSYDVVLENSVSEVPALTASSTDAEASIVITNAESLPGTSTVNVTASDGETTATYTVNFTYELSDDASLSAINVDGVSIEGFASSQLSYDVVLPAGTSNVPVVTATTSNSAAIAVINNAASVPGVTTIVVTAEDGSTIVTYTINFTIGTSSVSLENNAVKVFPTISNASFTVTSNEPVKRIIVFDLLGNKVKSMNDIGLSGEVSIERPGMYLMVVESDNAQNMFRVIKK
ncbi:LamG-like jellyroll fold domain-containing protein [Roseimarinus sediminis]|uniref:LamG-like jellyroll fold domain-containing protein n=1 Tax=Roseimarinus sediminis TaxID=1610899 RepID=UPI003D24A613